jgi:hypothetical protein
LALSCCFQGTQDGDQTEDVPQLAQGVHHVDDVVALGRGDIDGLLVSVLSSLKKELTPITHPNNPSDTNNPSPITPPLKKELTPITPPVEKRTDTNNPANNPSTPDRWPVKMKRGR